jgi:hypothetical protein
VLRFCVLVGVLTVPLSDPDPPPPPVLVTIRVIVVVLVRVPEVPVMVSVEVPTGVDAAVVTLRVEVPDPTVIVAGLNVPVAPLGNPAIDNAVLPVKPPVAVTVMV